MRNEPPICQKPEEKHDRLLPERSRADTRQKGSGIQLRERFGTENSNHKDGICSHLMGFCPVSIEVLFPKSCQLICSLGPLPKCFTCFLDGHSSAFA